MRAAVKGAAVMGAAVLGAAVLGWVSAAGAWVWRIPKRSAAVPPATSAINGMTIFIVVALMIVIR